MQILVKSKEKDFKRMFQIHTSIIIIGWEFCRVSMEVIEPTEMAACFMLPVKQ